MCRDPAGAPRIVAEQQVGGAPVTQEYADAVGADGYSADASSAVKKAKELVARQRGAVPA